MPWAIVLRLLRQGGPALLKALPKLWPLLMDPKTRTALLSAVKDAASKAPGQRLRGQVEATAVVARGLKDEAVDEAESERAHAWERRAGSLAKMLDLPAADRSSRARRRKAVKSQLLELQTEMSNHLESLR